MKTGKEHKVPLSDAALSILHGLAKLRQSELVFPGQKAGHPLSNMSMLKVLERMNYPGLTTHGFRSTFRDWVAEKTDFLGEVAEKALAHAISHKVEAAYRRGDMFEKRRELMEAWANYCQVRTAASSCT
jgi:integrase